MNNYMLHKCKRDDFLRFFWRKISPLFTFNSLLRFFRLNDNVSLSHVHRTLFSYVFMSKSIYRNQIDVTFGPFIESKPLNPATFSSPFFTTFPTVFLCSTDKSSSEKDKSITLDTLDDDLCKQILCLKPERKTVSYNVF